MKQVWRVTRITLGVMLLILGTVSITASIAAAGAVAGVDATVGRSGIVAQPFGSVSSEPNQIAVITDSVSATWELPQEPDWIATTLLLLGTDAETAVEDVGDFVFIVTPDQADEIFVGLAPVGAVDAYLDGTPYAVAVADGEQWPTISVPGEGVPGTRPEGAGIWSISAVGAPAELPLEALNGSTLVLMNADGSPGVAASMRMEYRVPDATRAMEGSAVSAAAGAIGGFAMILLGAFMVVGRRRRGRHA